MQIRIEAAPVGAHELPDGEQVAVFWQPHHLRIVYSDKAHPLTVAGVIAAEIGAALGEAHPPR